MSSVPPTLRSIALALLCGALTACAPQQEAPGSPAVSDAGGAAVDVGFLAFGDSGYHLAYLKAKDYTPALATQEEYVASQRAKWVKDMRPLADFQPAPAQYVASYNSYVPASGLDPVAAAMKRFCVTSDCEFALMLGDNIYPDGATQGLDGHDDALRFERLFTRPFGGLGGKSADFRIYATLGNHDWKTSREGTMAQLKFLEETPPFYMDGLFYRVKPPAGKGQVELFVVDTTMLLAGQQVPEDALNPDGSEKALDEYENPPPWSRPATDAQRDMVGWLEESLRSSKARWKFVVGHNPIWSGGGSKFQQARVLRELLLPTLCRYADAYFAGHEHTLEIHEDTCETVAGTDHSRPLVEVVSGAAAKQRGLNSAFMAYQSAAYPSNVTVFARGMIWGFAHIQLQGDRARVQLLSQGAATSTDPVLEFEYEFERRSST